MRNYRVNLDLGSVFFNKIKTNFIFHDVATIVQAVQCLHFNSKLQNQLRKAHSLTLQRL